MAWLLTPDELEAARTAVRDGDVTPELYGFIWRLTAATARRGLFAPVLSPTRKWDDEGIAETVQGWFERLLNGSLQRAFDRCQSPEELSRYLQAALGNWLRDRSRSEQRPRLLIRGRELLRDGPYRVHLESRSWLDEWWGPEQWRDAQPHAGDIRALIAAAHSMGALEVVRWSGDRADPVISTEDLQRLLDAVFDEGQLLSLRVIDEVLQARFPHAFIHDLDPEQPPDDLAVPEIDALSEIAARQSAERALARLSQRQVAVLLARTRATRTLEDLAAEHHCSRGTVDNEFRRAIGLVAEEAANADEARLILEKMLEIAFVTADG